MTDKQTDIQTDRQTDMLTYGTNASFEWANASECVLARFARVVANVRLVPK